MVGKDTRAQDRQCAAKVDHTSRAGSGSAGSLDQPLTAETYGTLVSYRILHPPLRLERLESLASMVLKRNPLEYEAQ